MHSTTAQDVESSIHDGPWLRCPRAGALQARFSRNCQIATCEGPSATCNVHKQRHEHGPPCPQRERHAPMHVVSFFRRIFVTVSFCRLWGGRRCERFLKSNTHEPLAREQHTHF